VLPSAALVRMPERRRFDYDFCRGRILAAAKNMQAIKKPMTM
jgi:hypothetical protein